MQQHMQRYVDDDIRQEIATVLRAHGIRETKRFRELLQDMGELYMRERWGCKGDLHKQDSMRYSAERAVREEVRAKVAALAMADAACAGRRLARRGVSKRRLPADWRYRDWGHLGDEA